jgi:hypothetical protein
VAGILSVAVVVSSRKGAAPTCCFVGQPGHPVDTGNPEVGKFLYSQLATATVQIRPSKLLVKLPCKNGTWQERRDKPLARLFLLPYHVSVDVSNFCHLQIKLGLPWPFHPHLAI